MTLWLMVLLEEPEMKLTAPPNGLIMRSPLKVFSAALESWRATEELLFAERVDWLKELLLAPGPAIKTVAPPEFAK